MNHNAIGRGYETFGNGTAETILWSTGRKEELTPEHMTTEWYRPVPAPSGLFLVGPRHRQLQRNRRVGGSGLCGRPLPLAVAKFLYQGPAQLAQGVGGAALRIRHSGGSGRSDARRPDGRQAEVAAHRGESQRLAADAQGGPFSRRHLCGANGSALPQLRLGSAGAAGISEGWRPSRTTMCRGNCRPTTTCWRVASADAGVRDANLTLLIEAPSPRGEIAGGGPAYVLKDSGQEGLLEARFRLARFTVEIAERAFLSRRRLSGGFLADPRPEPDSPTSCARAAALGPEFL